MNEQSINKEINISQQISIKPTDICIPRMEQSITRQTIFDTFKKLNIGRIERITENPLKNDPTYKRVILRIKWNSTEKAVNINNRLNTNQPVNIVYELPWYWRVVLSNK